jgi:hypothetical protein
MAVEENPSTGPRTEEGKQRSSQNSLKHGIFARTILIPGESQEDFDKLLYHYKRDYQPKGEPEEDLIRLLAETEWRRRRIPLLEAEAFNQALEAGDLECKFMHTYGIYEQRLNRTFQLTLKTFLAARDARRRETAVRFQIAAAIYKDQSVHGMSWNPPDDGFVFSAELMEQKYQLVDHILEARQIGFLVIDELDLATFLSEHAQ